MTPVAPAPLEVVVSLTRQTLVVQRGGRVEWECLVSTSRYGPGEQRGSLCTPRGAHFIRAKIGAGLPSGAVLLGRRPTGEVGGPALYRAQPGRDWILSRILWLSGLERQRNRGGEVDTFRRYIYLHGTPDQVPMGVPFSHGCIRMRNADVCWLCDAVEPGTLVHLVT